MTDLQDDLLNNRDEGAARPRARRSRARSSTLLLSVSNRLAALTSLEEQLDALIQISVETTDADRGTLFLNDATTGELYARVARGKSCATSGSRTAPASPASSSPPARD